MSGRRRNWIYPNSTKTYLNNIWSSFCLHAGCRVDSGGTQNTPIWKCITVPEGPLRQTIHLKENCGTRSPISWTRHTSYPSTTDTFETTENFFVHQFWKATLRRSVESYTAYYLKLHQDRLGSPATLCQENRESSTSHQVGTKTRGKYKKKHTVKQYSFLSLKISDFNTFICT